LRRLPRILFREVVKATAGGPSSELKAEGTYRLYDQSQTDLEAKAVRLAEINVMHGRPDAALDSLEYYFDWEPALWVADMLSLQSLRLDPSVRQAGASARSEQNLRNLAAQTAACALRDEKLPNVVNGVAR
jgi:hypothetical protein